MLEKYLRMQLGTGYCGTDEVLYFKLENQDQTELTPDDYEQYSEYAVDHNESFGYDLQDYVEKNFEDVDDDEIDEYYDDYVLNCTEHGYIEIVELDPEDDNSFSDGTLEDMLW